MVDSLFPADARSGAPLYSGRMLRQTASPLLAGATPARPLGGRTGVRPGTSKTVVSVTSTTWACGPFAGAADLQAAAEAAPYQFAFDSSTSGSLSLANATNPRIDIVWVQIDDPAEGDLTAAPVVRRGYTAGVPSATPIAPSPPARAFTIANIPVPRAGAGSPSVTFVAPYTVAAGGWLPVDTLANLRTIPGVDGQHATVFADTVPNVNNNGDYRWSGTAWVAIGASHQEYTFTVSGVGDGVLFSNFAFTADPNNSTDMEGTSIVASRLRLALPGIYAISVIGTSTALFTARSALLIATASLELARTTVYGSENVMSAEAPNAYIPSPNTDVTISLIKTAGGLSSFNARLRVTRLRTL